MSTAITAIQRRMADINNELRTTPLSPARKRTLTAAAKVERKKYIEILKPLAIKHGAVAKEQAEHINYLPLGADNNKIKKNKKACDRGGSTGSCRFCSAHLRLIYPANILGDHQASEWCVQGRHRQECCLHSNECALCYIQINDNWSATGPVNLAEALSDGINGNTRVDGYQQRRLLSFMLSHIGTDYPDPETKREYTSLRVWVNDHLWIEYFLKLSYHSSFLKTSSPSGYNYKDKIGFGREVRIQGNGNKDLVLCLIEDPNCADHDGDGAAPMVNGVGFWNLTKGAEPGEIRNIIQLNKERVLDVAFKFLIRNPQNIRSIRVELKCTQKNLKMKDEILPLWSYPVTDPVMMHQQEGVDPMEVTEVLEHTDSSDSTASLSPVASGVPNHFQPAHTMMGDIGDEAVVVPPPLPPIPMVPMVQSMPTENTMDFAEFQPFHQSVIPDPRPCSLPMQFPQNGVSGLAAFQPPEPSNVPNGWDHDLNRNVMQHPVPMANHHIDSVPVPLTFPPNPILSDPLDLTFPSNGESMQRQNTNSLPPLPPQIQLQHQRAVQMDTMSIAPSNQMGRDSSCSVAPFLGNQWIDPEMQSLAGGLGGYHGVHHGSYDFNHSNPLFGIGRPDTPFNV